MKILYDGLTRLLYSNLCLQVEHPQASTGSAWRKIVSTQRKRAVVACFRMVHLYSIPRYNLHFCNVIHASLHQKLISGTDASTYSYRLTKKSGWRKRMWARIC